MQEGLGLRIESGGCGGQIQVTHRTWSLRLPFDVDGHGPA